MDVVSVGILLVCVAGSLALVALAWALLSVANAARAATDVMEQKVSPALDEARALISDMPPLVESATDVANTANKVLDDVEVVSSKVAHAAEKASEIAHVPIEFASNVAEVLTSSQACPPT